MKAILRAIKVVLMGIAGFVLVVGGIVGCLRGGMWLAKQRAERLSHLAAHVDRYVEVVTHPVSGQSGSTSRRATGKPVFLCMCGNKNDSLARPRHDRSIDLLTLELPASLFPQKADEVNTVVALRWGQVEVGKYANGSRAMQEICRVTVHDLSTGQMIARREFVGGKPPETVSKYTEPSSLAFGGSCEKEILGYVLSLLGSPE